MAAILNEFRSVNFLQAKIKARISCPLKGPGRKRGTLGRATFCIGDLSNNSSLTAQLKNADKLE